MRKGVGRLVILDGDKVEMSNLNRQFFTEEDLYRNKALSLAKNLARIAPGSTLIEAYPYFLEGFLTLGVEVGADIWIIGVDDNAPRYSSSQISLGKSAVIFIAVDETADHGYVFIQEKNGKPCFNCILPKPPTTSGRKKCTPAGAVKDILKVVSGIGLYAVDTLLMDRKRDWNYRYISLAGFTPDITRWVEPKPDCPVCSQPDRSD